VKRRFEIAGRPDPSVVTLTAKDEASFCIDWRDEVIELELEEIGPGRYLLRDGLRLFDVIVGSQGSALRVTRRGVSHVVELIDERRAARAAVRNGVAKQGGCSITSPMPGKVIRCLVSQGQAVKAEQGLIIVEAMKMENELRAAGDGLVKAILVQQGQTVEAGQQLVLIESSDGNA
jgi:pyruvate carboxylase subunit B